MPISAYSTDRDTNATIAPGNIKAPASDNWAQQMVNSIRQIMADIAGAGLAAGFKVTTFTAGGTFTTDAKCIFADVWCYGGGGAGGGSPATGVGQFSVGAGGHAGAMAFKRLLAATIGASQTVTIGAGGTANNGAAGGAGGDTTFGALVSAKGGGGGRSNGPSTPSFSSDVLAEQQSATGDVRGWTSPGGIGWALSVTIHGGEGGVNGLGGSGIGAHVGTASNAAGGSAQANTGAGGGGAANGASLSSAFGGAGGSGFCYVIEYLKP